MKIVLSLEVATPLELAQAEQFAEGRADLLELRLDGLSDSVDIQTLVAGATMQVLATCMPAQEGGRFAGSEVERKQRIQAAVAGGARWVDHSLTQPLWDIPDEVSCVHSFHQQAGAQVDWTQVFGQLQERARPGDLMKMVAWADTEPDTRPLLGFAAAKPSLIAFAQGPAGGPSRMQAVAQGCPWIYTCMPGSETAPGQWNLDEVASLPVRDLAAGKGKLFAVLGHPVAESRSPLQWNTAFALENRSDLYLAIDTLDLGGFLRACRSGMWGGFSVTMPLKEAALDAADAADEGAHEVGAANTLLPVATQGGHDEWAALNTDGIGALEALKRAGLPAQSRFLVLGAGGAARAVAYEATRRGHRVTFAVRSPEKVAAFAKKISAEIVDWAGAIPADFDAIAQATPVGSGHTPGDPLEGKELRAGQWVLDLVYAPTLTPLLVRAIHAGARPILGSEMLLRQMIAQYRGAVRADVGDALADAIAAHSQAGLPGPPAVVLIGPRGSGKTSLGAALAAKLGRPFFDADVLLELRAGKAIDTWLPEDEASFRAAESALVQEMIHYRGAIVALGGGAAEHLETRTALSAHSAVWHLSASPEVLHERQASAPRPPLTDLNPLDEVRNLLSEREAGYIEASSNRHCPTNGEFQTVLTVLETLVSGDPHSEV